MDLNQWAAAILVPILAALLTYFGVRVTSRRSMTVGREANAVTFSRDLLGRVATLEEDVGELRAQLEAVKGVVGHATGWIEHALRWLSAGRHGNPPALTAQLKEHLNPWVVTDYEKFVEGRVDEGDTQPPTHDKDADAR
jgi:hypothetical protein